LIFKLAKDYI